jgi:hypothetical protein
VPGGGHVILEPFDATGRLRNCQISQTLVDGSRTGIHAIQVRNPSDYKIRIKRNTCVAHVFEVEPDSVKNLESELINPTNSVDLVEVKNLWDSVKTTTDVRNFDTLGIRLSDELSAQQKHAIKTLVEKHIDVFAMDLTEVTGAHDYVHEINLIPGSVPTRSRVHAASTECK